MPQEAQKSLQEAPNKQEVTKRPLELQKRPQERQRGPKIGQEHHPDSLFLFLGTFPGQFWIWKPARANCAAIWGPSKPFWQPQGQPVTTLGRHPRATWHYPRTGRMRSAFRRHRGWSTGMKRARCERYRFCSISFPTGPANHARHHRP